MKNNIYQNQISQRDDEYTEFLCWILEQRDWENDIMIIKGQEYDRFMESDNEDEEIDIKIVEQILENRNNDKDTRTKHVITQCYISAKETKELFENK